jgi:hypothetical protein
VSNLNSPVQYLLDKMSASEDPVVKQRVFRNRRIQGGTRSSPAAGEFERRGIAHAVRDKRFIIAPSDFTFSREKRQNLVHSNRRPGRAPQQFKMPAPRKIRQGIEIADHPGAHGVQMDVAHQLQQIRVLVADDGLVAILKECPARLWRRLNTTA